MANILNVSDIPDEWERLELFDGLTTKKFVKVAICDTFYSDYDFKNMRDDQDIQTFKIKLEKSILAMFDEKYHSTERIMKEVANFKLTHPFEEGKLAIPDELFKPIVRRIKEMTHKHDRERANKEEELEDYKRSALNEVNRDPLFKDNQMLDIAIYINEAGRICTKCPFCRAEQMVDAFHKNTNIRYKHPGNLGNHMVVCSERPKANANDYAAIVRQ